MKWLLSVLVGVGAVAFAVAEPDKPKEPEVKDAAKVVLTGQVVGVSEVTFFAKVNGKTIDIDVKLVALKVGKDAVVNAIVPKTLKTEDFSPFGDNVVCVEGRLKVDKLQTGFVIDYGGELKLDDKKVLLDVTSLSVVNDKNKEKFPPQGKAYVEGPAICGKNDLKKFDEPTLAVKNGDAPIVLTGDKAKDDASKRGVIGVTGTLSVDGKKGVVLITADEVKDVKKKE
jgi:hypothetical protein